MDPPHYQHEESYKETQNKYRSQRLSRFHAGGRRAFPARFPASSLPRDRASARATTARPQGGRRPRPDGN